MLGLTESSTSVDESNNILDDDDLMKMNGTSRTDDEDIIDNVYADGVINSRLVNSNSITTLPNHKTISKNNS